MPRCGDAILSPGEQCDDGNTFPGDSCSATCLVETQPVPICGDGIISEGESCDDRNRLSGDGCSSVCQPEARRTPQCGDGILDVGEQCDDGNLAFGDGCSLFCRIEDTSVAIGLACGNGVIDPGEECDDGNQRDFDGCGGTCFWEEGSCGDGVVQHSLGEQCEPGMLPQGAMYACSNDCRYVLLRCGNGSLDPGEECDDGQDNSNLPNALCRLDCTRSGCGDGIFDTGEQCDDGNLLPGDGCDRSCRREIGAALPQGTQQAIDFPGQGQNLSAGSQIGQLNPYDFQNPFGGQVQPPVTPRPPSQTDSGPVAVAVMAAGAAAGAAWVRRRRSSRP